MSKSKKGVSFRFSQETLKKLDEIIQHRNQTVDIYNKYTLSRYRLERWNRTSILECLVQKEHRDNILKHPTSEDIQKE
ncbi:hypothetical protein ACFDTO_17890 [Microbacteriaceae bacterium 4G12]